MRFRCLVNEAAFTRWGDPASGTIAVANRDFTSKRPQQDIYEMSSSRIHEPKLVRSPLYFIICLYNFYFFFMSNSCSLH